MLCIVPGVGFLFLVLVFLLGALGDILVAVGLLLDVAGFLRPGPSSMDDHADGKVELLQGGWC